MGQHQLLADAGEDDMVLADVVAAAQRGETDRTGRAWPGDAVAARALPPRRILRPRARGGAAEGQRRAGRGASTLARWCISMISRSNRARAGGAT